MLSIIQSFDRIGFWTKIYKNRLINECARNDLAIRKNLAVINDLAMGKNLPNVTSMTFEVILHLIEYLCLHDISILSIYSLIQFIRI
jgi:hypothetical protein